MKFYLNSLLIIFLSFFMISCSTINDWDVIRIIDKTERWLFDTEDNSDEKEVSIDEINEKEFTEEKVEVEEVFPDINDVPQIKPEFEEIDENFFESEKELESNEADNFNVEFCYGLDSMAHTMKGNSGLFIQGGKNALRFTPHFRITSEEIDLIIKIVREAIIEFSRK